LEMKPKMLVKLFLAALLGSLFGGSIAFDHSRWFRLGRSFCRAVHRFRNDRFQDGFALPAIGPLSLARSVSQAVRKTMSEIPGAC
jgi:hypothetical protein